MEAGLADAGRADRLRRVPTNRFAKPAEVAAMLAFPSGPDGTFPTGPVFEPWGGRPHH